MRIQMRPDIAHHRHLTYDKQTSCFIVCTGHCLVKRCLSEFDRLMNQKYHSILDVVCSFVAQQCRTDDGIGKRDEQLKQKNRVWNE